MPHTLFSAPRSLRRLVLALLTIGLLMRVAMPCEAMAAPAATTPMTHCAPHGTAPAKPVKAAGADCAVCVTLPDAAAPASHRPLYVAVEPLEAPRGGLHGLAGGPAPPPPRGA